LMSEFILDYNFSATIVPLYPMSFQNQHLPGIEMENIYE
jgi:hypothetical protein